MYCPLKKTKSYVQCPVTHQLVECSDDEPIEYQPTEDDLLQFRDYCEENRLEDYKKEHLTDYKNINLRLEALRKKVEAYECRDHDQSESSAGSCHCDECETCLLEDNKFYGNSKKLVNGVSAAFYDYLPYCYTLRKVTKNKHATEQMYLDHLDKIFEKKNMRYYENNFETTAGLHCHGIVDIPANFNFKKFRVRGWNIYLCPCNNKQQWLKYITKDKKD